MTRPRTRPKRPRSQARLPTREELWRAYEHANAIYLREGASLAYEQAWERYSALILARWGDRGLTAVRAMRP